MDAFPPLWVVYVVKKEGLIKEEQPIAGRIESGEIIERRPCNARWEGLQKFKVANNRAIPKIAVSVMTSDGIERV